MKRTRKRKFGFRLSEYRKADIAVLVTAVIMFSLVIILGKAFQPVSVLRPDTAATHMGARK